MKIGAQDQQHHERQKQRDRRSCNGAFSSNARKRTQRSAVAVRALRPV